MLTSDLIRARRQGRLVVPKFLSEAERARLIPVANGLLAAIEQAHGTNREDLEARFGAIDHHPRDHAVVLGLEKLLLDRCEFVAPEGEDAAELRSVVFRLAAEARCALGPVDRFSRDRVLARASEQLGLPTARIESRLFADLRKNERLVSFRPISPARLFERYDVALAQGILLRARRVSVTLQGEEPGRARQLFRAARFHGLLSRVTGTEEGWRIELDGPMSLFSSAQKYGLDLALFLPAVLRCTNWSLEADLLWGKARTPARLELRPQHGLVTHGPPIAGVAPDLARFVEGFRSLESSWDLAQSEDLIAIPGEAVVVPDLVFTSRHTGEKVWLEAFGYWSRSAVWQRIETVRRGFPGRLLLAVGKHLRVSEDSLDESEAGELYVYRTAMQPKAVLERLERGPTAS